MNFVYDPKIAAQIAVGTSYISSVKGVQGGGRRSSTPTRRTTRSSSRTTRRSSQVHQNDPAMLNNDDYITRWQEVQGQ